MTSFLRKLVFLLATANLLTVAAQRDLKFYEIVENDSLRLFYNEKNKFVEKECSKYTRYVRVDANGNLNGYFKDIQNEGEVTLRTGRYIYGEKNGLFEEYHHNGKLKSKGLYRMNKPYGRWEFSNEKEELERVVKFTQFDILLIVQKNKLGEEIVSDGKGVFKGEVTLSINDSPMIASGEIVEGKRHGEWTVEFSGSDFYDEGTIYCKELFKFGEFVKGNLFITRANSGYETTSMFSQFFDNNDLKTLERVITMSCGATNVIAQTKNASFDNNNFQSSLKNAFDNVLGSGKNLEIYGVGDYVLQMDFQINKDGKPEDFSQLSSWGDPFYRAFKSVLRQSSFPRRSQRLKFSFKLHYAGGSSVRYSYSFF